MIKLVKIMKNKSTAKNTTTPASVGFISEVMTSITNLIKIEGKKVDLQILSAAAGVLAVTKAVS
jgi:hypothetical protein